MKYVRPYWPYFIFGPLCMIVEVLGEVILPKLYALIVNNGVEGGMGPGYIGWAMAFMIGTAILMMAGGVGGAYFGAEVELELLFPEGQVSAFLEKLTDLSSGTVEGMETGQEYRAFPIDRETT